MATCGAGTTSDESPTGYRNPAVDRYFQAAQRSCADRSRNRRDEAPASRCGGNGSALDQLSPRRPREQAHPWSAGSPPAGLPNQLRALSVGTFIYAGLLATEGTGLLLRKRWAEYFTIITTAGFIPLGVYELSRHLRYLKSAC